MAYANSNGVQIHYVVEGIGEPLLFVHGIAGNLESWSNIAEALNDEFQCIRMDARGHGNSDKLAAVEDYTPELMASDVVSVLDDLGIEKINYVGYSMGGFIGSAMAKFYPERLRTLVIGGAVPSGKATAEQATIGVLKNAFKIGLESGPQEFIEYLEKTFGPPQPERRALYLRTEKEGFQAYISALAAFERHSYDFSAEYRALTIPLLIYMGDKDEIYGDFAKHGAQEYPNSEVVVVENMRHTEGYLPVVIPLLRSFMQLDL